MYAERGSLMNKAVLMSINPEWVRKIMSGEKTKEVRKRAPLTKHPYKVYIYCTKNGEQYEHFNGTVCGEFTCVSTTEYSPPWNNKTFGTCLWPKDLYTYAAGACQLCYMAIENPVLYDKPKNLVDFGLEHPPMSWQYVEEIKP